MATAIVAAVALPLLAMLAGSASTQGEARDRGISARIAAEIAASVVPSPPDRFALHLSGGDPILLPAPDGGTTISHLLFDAGGRFLGESDDDTWSNGTGGRGDGTHLVEMRIRPAEGIPASATRLCELELTVARPAAASLGAAAAGLGIANEALPPLPNLVASGAVKAALFGLIYPGLYAAMPGGVSELRRCLDALRELKPERRSAKEAQGEKAP